MKEKQPLHVYEDNIKRYEALLKELQKKRRQIGWLRLLIVLSTILAVYALWPAAAWLVAVIVIGLSVFLFIVSLDADNGQSIANTERLLSINQQEAAILKGHFLERENGTTWEPAHHAYAQDLDIFGTSSLYQYLNRCTAEQSKQRLALRLLQPQQKADILQTQQAVKELHSQLEWRQQLQAFGMQQPLGRQTENSIKNWLVESAIFQAKYWHLLSVVFPILSLLCIGLYAAEILTGSLFSLITFGCFILAFLLSRKIHSTYILLSKTVTEITTLFRQLHHFEKENFESPMMAALKKSIASKPGQNASGEIRQLKNLLNRFDMRLNIFAFFFLNTFLLWDLQQMLALNRWKKKNSESVSHWFESIAQMEFLSSLASLSFNQTDWCFPEIADAHFTLKGTGIGHPLIPAGQRVNNDIRMQGTGQIALITGSNMAGKSTFLRSIGVNAVLAFAGAPVCASLFTISPVLLMSSMRIADNLAENTSTFYAELKKLQGIIEAVNRHEKVFILLDEILRGTNSIDRHTGSKALIQQLIKQQAVAMIATHDIELTVLSKENPQAIANYYFDVQVDKNSELFFDYKLKDGICKSMNASILMKKIGIEIHDQTPEKWE